MANEIIKTTLHPDGNTEKLLYPVTSVDQIVSSDGTDLRFIIGIEEISDEVVGNQTLTTVRVYYSDSTSDDLVIYAQNATAEYISISGTSGTLTSAQYNTLIGNLVNYIVLDNEVYRLSNESSMIYVNVSCSNANVYIKNITVSSNYSWTLSTVKVVGEVV